MLEHYFHPLNPQNLLLFSIIIILLYSLGYTIAKILKIPRDFQFSYWILGLAIYIFIISILHVFFPFNAKISWATLILISFYPLLEFIRKKDFLALLKKFLSFPYAFLAVAPLAKQFYFLLSKPPNRWDELHYHFFSPAKMMMEQRWDFFNQNPPYVFSMFPRFLGTSYTTMLSLTNTYSTAQLLHFFLFLSSLTTLGIILKNKLKIIPTILFIISAIYFYPELLQNSTQGYVDAGLTTLIILILIYLAKFLSAPNKKYFSLISILSAITISIKYNSVISLLGLSFATLVQGKMSAIKKIVDRKTLIISAALSIVFGGYWYIKNLLITGNPIYPYFFKCINNYPCGKNAPNLLDQYTLSFSSENFQKIIDQITFENHNLFYFALFCFALSLLLSIFNKKKFLIRLLLTLAILIPIEILINNFISGYQNRFFYHWNLLISLIIFIPLSFLSFSNTRRIALSTLIILLYFSFAGNLYTQLSKGFNAFKNPGFYTGEDILFAKNYMNLEKWLSFRYPENYTLATNFCNSDEKKTILIADKYTNHLNYNGFIRAFFTNCEVFYLPSSTELNLDSEDYTYLKNEIQKRYPNSFIFSTLSCSDNTISFDSSYSPKEIIFSNFAASVVCQGHSSNHPSIYEL